MCRESAYCVRSAAVADEVATENHTTFLDRGSANCIFICLIVMYLLTGKVILREVMVVKDEIIETLLLQFYFFSNYTDIAKRA